MKKLIYIVIALFGLGIVSCSKQDIKPLSNETLVVPAWSSNERGAGENGSPEGDESGSSSDDDGGTVTVDDTDITDPNNDPDGSKKGKGNK